MEDDGLSMDEVLAVLSITDDFGLHREKVSIPLEKGNLGSVRRLPSGDLEVIAPKEMSVHAWLPSLRHALIALGFQPVEEPA